MIQEFGAELQQTSRRLQIVLLTIAAVQCVSTGIFFTLPNLASLVLQLSIILVGYSGAKRYNARLLHTFVIFRVGLWLLNICLFLVYLLFPSYFNEIFAEHHDANHAVPSDNMAAHATHFSKAGWTAMVIVSFASGFFYTLLHIWSVVLALRLRAYVLLCVDVLPQHIGDRLDEEADALRDYESQLQHRIHAHHTKGSDSGTEYMPVPLKEQQAQYACVAQLPAHTAPSMVYDDAAAVPQPAPFVMQPPAFNVSPEQIAAANANASAYIPAQVVLYPNIDHVDEQ
jgi:hypothetical protein